jgi:hypothetical protein
MRTTPQPTEIRRFVTVTFRQFGARVDTPLDLGETIRLDDGKYVARTYQVDGFMAMWLIDVGILQFYDSDGNMLLTVNLFSEMAPQKAVA